METTAASATLGFEQEFTMSRTTGDRSLVSIGVPVIRFNQVGSPK